ncbi:hypothetical protein LENED_005972 [Lentinula edodes]|uniref:Uncharacterized protein n=1 Tax=Lentinula edodes TaxID=5353 RepID=A0A1Q3EAE3_LENED|nr:hypothetical protein LENED_005972 [Lentinula edodes]
MPLDLLCVIRYKIIKHLFGQNCSLCKPAHSQCLHRRLRTVGIQTTMWTSHLSVLLIISTILLGVLSFPVASPAYPSFAGLERRVGSEVPSIESRLWLIRRVLKDGELIVLDSRSDVKVDKNERWGICIDSECFELTLEGSIEIEVYHEFMRPTWKTNRHEIPITDLGAKVNWGLGSIKVAVVNEFKHTAYGSHDDLGFLNDVLHAPPPLDDIYSTSSSR